MNAEDAEIARGARRCRSARIARQLHAPVDVPRSRAAEDLRAPRAISASSAFLLFSVDPRMTVPA